MSSLITKTSLWLGAFSAAAIVLSVLTFEVSAEKRQTNILNKKRTMLTEVLPAQYFDNNLLASTLSVTAHPLLGTHETRTGYLATKHGQPVALILSITAPDGYNGDIDLFVAISSDGIIRGVRVIPPHHETPGLGDKIERRKSAWIEQFVNRRLSGASHSADNTWAVKKLGGHFDQMTGATITSSAVIKAVHNALRYFEQTHDRLFQQSLFMQSQHTQPRPNPQVKQQP